MDDNTIKIIELEQHETKDVNDGHINGVLTVLWRDWDKIIPINPKMIYISSVKPNEKKGPHLHKKRNSYFICIKGKLAFVIKQKNGTYEEIIVSSDKPKLIVVPKEYASAHINLHDDVSIILALVEPAWRPENRDEHNITFDDYDWEKWNIKNHN